MLACLTLVYWNLEEQIYGQIDNLTVDLACRESYYENATQTKTVESAVMPTN